MAWVTTDEVGRVIGTAQVTALGFGDSALFGQFEALARAKVSSVLQYAGYALPADTALPNTSAGAFIGHMTMAVLVASAYGTRKGIRFNPYVQEGLDSMAAVYEKRLPIPGMSPGTLAGHGGVKGSSISEGSTDQRVPAFARKNMSGY